MVCFVYILKSTVVGKFYIGQTSDPEQRLQFHNSGKINHYTNKYRPWEMVWSLKCNSREQARKIEAHLKRMKSKIYLENLMIYPEIGQKLLIRYSEN